MNILFNISHPAHVHLFRNLIHRLYQDGHKLVVAARKKEFTSDLLQAYDIDHALLTKKGDGLAGLVRELLLQQIKLSRLVRQHDIELMIQMNGIFIAPVGRFHGIPTLAFSDTENDVWGNRISFPLCRHVFSPTCFDTEIGGEWRNQIFYPGYHELAYLAPSQFSGVPEPEECFLVRFVGWKAGHDIGETGMCAAEKIALIRTLSRFGKVHVSSEAPLLDEMAEFACSIDPADIHRFMLKCKMVVGESATMASEAACMGIPAIFLSNTGRGYTTEQERRYGLIKHFRLNQWEEFITQVETWAGSDLRDEWQRRRWKMLEDKMDVTQWMTDLVEGYPRSISAARDGKFLRYRIPCAA